MFKKVLAAVLAVTATAVAVKVVSDILEATEQDNNLIDLNEMEQKEAETVLIEVDNQSAQ